MIRAQRRRRRLRFWMVFLALAALGGTWAGLTKDPLGPGLIQEGQMVGAVPQPAPVEVRATAVEVEADEDTTTTEGP